MNVRLVQGLLLWVDCVATVVLNHFVPANAAGLLVIIAIHATNLINEKIQMLYWGNPALWNVHEHKKVACF